MARQGSRSPQTVSRGDRPFLLGIAGPSCSGKTSVAHRLAELLELDPPAVVSLDGFYRDLAGVAEEDREALNFDMPDAIDVELLLQTVSALAQGECVELPVYDFAIHTRSAHTTQMQPGAVVVVEGLFALAWARLRSLLNLSVYVHAESQVCRQRRIERDVAERGRHRQDVEMQFASTVEPMLRKHILPTKQHADLIIDGQKPVEDSAQKVLSLVQRSA